MTIQESKYLLCWTPTQDSKEIFLFLFHRCTFLNGWPFAIHSFMESSSFIMQFLFYLGLCLSCLYLSWVASSFHLQCASILPRSGWKVKVREKEMITSWQTFYTFSGFSLIDIDSVYSPTSMYSMWVQRVCKKNEGGEIHGSGNSCKPSAICYCVAPWPFIPHPLWGVWVTVEFNVKVRSRKPMIATGVLIRLL